MHCANSAQVVFLVQVNMHRRARYQGPKFQFEKERKLESIEIVIAGNLFASRIVRVISFSSLFSRRKKCGRNFRVPSEWRFRSMFREWKRIGQRPPRLWVSDKSPPQTRDFFPRRKIRSRARCFLSLSLSFFLCCIFSGFATRKTQIVLFRFLCDASFSPPRAVLSLNSAHNSSFMQRRLNSITAKKTLFTVFCIFRARLNDAFQVFVLNCWVIAMHFSRELTRNY